MGIPCECCEVITGEECTATPCPNEGGGPFNYIQFYNVPEDVVVTIGGVTGSAAPDDDCATCGDANGDYAFNNPSPCSLTWGCVSSCPDAVLCFENPPFPATGRTDQVYEVTAGLFRVSGTGTCSFEGRGTLTIETFDGTNPRRTGTRTFKTNRVDYDTTGFTAMSPLRINAITLLNSLTWSTDSTTQQSGAACDVTGSTMDVAA